VDALKNRFGEDAVTKGTILRVKKAIDRDPEE
jgi:hypothetical protein